MSTARKGLQAVVLAYRPAVAPPDWMDTRNARLAASIPETTIQDDVDGETARLFGLETSGHVALYDVDGSLRFSGGITAARGHEGDSTGLLVLRAFLAGQQSVTDSTEVYGCPLASPTDCGEPAR